MTPERLEEIRANVAGSAQPHVGQACEIDTSVICPRCQGDLAAPADRADLLAEVERLWAENDRLRQLAAPYYHSEELDG